MALLDILTYPDPRLAEKSMPVETVTDETRQLVEDMLETMYDAEGVGLAAPQIGVLQRVIVVDCDQAFDDDGNRTSKGTAYAVINPEIVERDGKIIWQEGCLSVPDFSDDVERAAHVVVEGLNPAGEPIRIEADELLGVCLQHEIDHLDGVLFVDRLSRLKQTMVKKKLKKRAAEEE